MTLDIGTPRKLGTHSKCTDCGKPLNGATCAVGDHTPQPGDATICVYCGHWMVFSNDLTLRDPSVDEMREMAASVDFITLGRALAEMRKKGAI